MATSIGSGVPSGRVYLSAVWTGEAMIFWGGMISIGGGVSINNSGLIYPANDLNYLYQKSW